MSGTITLLPQFGSGDELPLVFRWLGIGPGQFLHQDGYWTAMISLTPEMAKLLLAPEVAHSNRERSPTFVAQFADDMLAEMWSPFCSVIECAGAVVVEGQTRMESVVVSGKPQRFLLVVRPADDPGIFDQAHKRKFAESEAMRASTLDEIPRRQRGPIATAIAIHRFWAGVSYDRYRRLSDQVKHNVLHADPHEAVLLHTARVAYHTAAHQPLPIAAAAGFAACLEHDRAAGSRFVDLFTDAARQDEAHPAYRLLHWLMGRKEDKTSVQQFYNAVVYSYDAFCGGRSVRNMTVPASQFLQPKGA